jgi:hypothetical protein
MERSKIFGFVEQYNPFHDSKTGKFASKDGGGGVSGTTSYLPKTRKELEKEIVDFTKTICGASCLAKKTVYADRVGVEFRNCYGYAEFQTGTIGLHPKIVKGLDEVMATGVVDEPRMQALMTNLHEAIHFTTRGKLDDYMYQNSRVYRFVEEGLTEALTRAHVPGLLERFGLNYPTIPAWSYMQETGRITLIASRVARAKGDVKMRDQYLWSWKLHQGQARLDRMKADVAEVFGVGMKHPALKKLFDPDRGVVSASDPAKFLQVFKELDPDIVPKGREGLLVTRKSAVEQFNPNHDDKTGKFTGRVGASSLPDNVLARFESPYEMRPINLMIDPERRAWLEARGHSSETFDKVRALFWEHGIGDETQRIADQKIMEELRANTPVGKCIRDLSTLENLLYDEWTKRAKKRFEGAFREAKKELESFGTYNGYEIESLRELKKYVADKVYHTQYVYRKGDPKNRKDIECWTTHSSGADTGGLGRLTPNMKSSIEDLRRDGYQILAGIGMMMGAPGEGEVTFIKMPKVKTTKSLVLDPSREPDLSFLPVTVQARVERLMGSAAIRHQTPEVRSRILDELRHVKSIERCSRETVLLFDFAEAELRGRTELSFVEQFNPHHDAKTGKFTGKLRLSRDYLTITTYPVPQVEPSTMKTKFERVQGTTIEEIADLLGISKPEAERKAIGAVQDYVDSSDLVIRVPIDVIHDVIKKGVKNQFETDRSEGDYNPDYRREVEYDLMGIDFSATPRERPVYGYFDHPDVKDYGAVGYGRVRLILNEDVKNRTTVTVGDSFDEPYKTAAAPARKIHTGALDDKRDALVEAIREGKKDSLGRVLQGSDYVEAQIHGGVTVRDVRRVEIEVNPGEPEQWYESIGRELDVIGVPWKYVKPK